MITDFHSYDAKLLVVDDSDMNLKIFISLLKGSGLQIDIAESGLKCLSMTAERSYDIIFMDYMMPEMDGIETVQKMKEDPENRNKETPVIMLTANEISEEGETYLETGFSGYLSKPIMKNELLSLIDKILNNAKNQSLNDNNGRKEIDPENEMKNPEEPKTGDSFSVLKKSFPDINIKLGLAYCSESEEFYIELLKDLAEPEKRDTLQKAFDEEDIKQYAIKIHAIKGNARTLGLVRLGQISEGLQFAAEKNEVDYVKENHAQVIELLEKLQNCMVEL